MLEQTLISGGKPAVEICLTIMQGSFYIVLYKCTLPL